MAFSNRACQELQNRARCEARILRPQSVRYAIDAVFNWSRKIIGRPDPHSVAHLRMITLYYPEKRWITHSSIWVRHLALEPHNGFILLIRAIKQFSNSIKCSCRVPPTLAGRAPCTEVMYFLLATHAYISAAQLDQLSSITMQKINIV